MDSYNSEQGGYTATEHSFQLHVMDSSRVKRKARRVGRSLSFQLHVMDSLSPAGSIGASASIFQLHVMDSGPWPHGSLSWRT